MTLSGHGLFYWGVDAVAVVMANAFSALLQPLSRAVMLPPPLSRPLRLQSRLIRFVKRLTRIERRACVLADDIRRAARTNATWDHDLWPTIRVA